MWYKCMYIFGVCVFMYVVENSIWCAKVGVYFWYMYMHIIYILYTGILYTFGVFLVCM
jgi:hypothetical protein